MRCLSLSLLLLVGSCASTPEFEHRSPAGLARSDDESVARMLAMTANLFAAPICAELQVEQTPAFVIWHDPDQPSAGLAVARDRHGRITDRRIVIGDLALRLQARFTLAHELVHWYSDVPPWDRLPHAVEEGLADYLACQLAPETRALRESDHTTTLAQITPDRRARALALTEREWATSPASVRSDTYAVGWEIVQRLGVEGLRDLCERAEASGLDRVPIAWLERSAAPSVARD